MRSDVSHRNIFRCFRVVLINIEVGLLILGDSTQLVVQVAKYRNPNRSYGSPRDWTRRVRGVHKERVDVAIDEKKRLRKEAWWFMVPVVGP